MIITIPEEQVKFEEEFTRELNSFILHYINKQISYHDFPLLITFLDDSIVIKESINSIVSKSYFFKSFLKPKTEEERKEEEFFLKKAREGDKK